jgi:hypothetical protein
MVGAHEAHARIDLNPTGGGNPISLPTPPPTESRPIRVVGRGSISPAQGFDRPLMSKSIEADWCWRVVFVASMF